MEPTSLKQPYKHSQININEEDVDEKSKDTQQNQKANNQLSSSHNTRSSYLSNINDAQRDFTKISLLNQENSMSRSKVYQEYLKNYHKSSSIHYIDVKLRGTNKFYYKLVIYNPKTGRVTKKAIDQNKIQIHPTACIAELPNRDLFCFGHFGDLNTIIIDRDFNFHILPPSGERCHNSSAIYYNRSVYCFGGNDECFLYPNLLKFSKRFDLDLNRWIKLSPLPEPAENCKVVIFNGNILISNPDSSRLWLYSIDTNSFSIIPYEFKCWNSAWRKIKIYTGEKSEWSKMMINTGQRLYLIEDHDYYEWRIYESDVEDEYAWKLIKNLGCLYGNLKYCLYNKDKERIYIISTLNPSNRCYKFDLKDKVLRKWKKCIIF